MAESAIFQFPALFRLPSEMNFTFFHFFVPWAPHMSLSRGEFIQNARFSIRTIIIIIIWARGRNILYYCLCRSSKLALEIKKQALCSPFHSGKFL